MSPTGKSIRFGRTHARTRAESGAEVGIGENRSAPPPFPFSLLAQDGISFEFCVVLVNPGEI